MSSTQNALYIHYPLTLLETEELVLSLCLSGLTYFGRKSRLQLLLWLRKLQSLTPSQTLKGRAL